MKKKVILWDLDGTIIDSEEGVTKCVQYALRHFGIEEPDLKKLRVFIGPPLRGQFRKVYGLTPEQAEIAVLKYRERFDEKGMYECGLYPQVEETLRSLKAKGYQQAIASSKNETACIEILRNLEIDQYFDLIGGATDDGKISQKADVLAMVMERMGQKDARSYVLIGDTGFDVLGANAVHMDCIGITYGFGTREELAGAVAVFADLREVEAYLDGEAFR